MRATDIRSRVAILLLLFIGLADIILVLVNATTPKKFKIGCENHNLTFSCDSLHPIICFGPVTFWIDSDNNMLCSSGARGKINTTCDNKDMLGYVLQQCQKINCTFLVSSKAMGDHCEGAFKYIKVMYKCVKSSPNSTNMESCIRDDKNKQPPKPTILEVIKDEEKSKTLKIVPSFSSNTVSSAFVSTNNSIQEVVQPSTSTREVHRFQFTATRRPSLKKDWGTTFVSVFTTSPRPTAIKKTCSRFQGNPRKIENSKVFPSSVNSFATAQGGRKNGSCKLAMHFLSKIILLCVGFMI